MAKRLKYIAYDGFPEHDEALYEMMRNMTPTDRFELCLKRMQEAIKTQKPDWSNLEWHVLRKRIKE